jgi:hypothetical protein
VLGLQIRNLVVDIFSLDVLATITVDTELEQEQNDAATQTSFLLVQGLRHNGDITKQVLWR